MDALGFLAWRRQQAVSSMSAQAALAFIGGEADDLLAGFGTVWPFLFLHGRSL